MSKAGDTTDNGARRSLKRTLRWAAMGATAFTFVALMAAGITGLHQMADAAAPVEAAPPVPVRAETIRLSEGYVLKTRYVGRLEPARETRLAFELSGLVTEIVVDEGDAVAAGEVIARLDTAKLEAERGRLQARRHELEAQLALANLTVERKKKLMQSGHGSVEKYDEARFAVDGLKASLENVDASARVLDVDIAKSVLRAPFSGRVGTRLVDEGAVVSPSHPIVHLLEAEKRQVRIGVSVVSSSALTPERRYALSADGRTYSARLISVRPDLSAATRTVSALFEVDGAGELPFGRIMQLALDQRVDEPGYWLPMEALVEGRKGLWTVYTLDGSGSPVVRREAVEVLYAERDRAFVRGTITAGTRVVLDGTNRVVPGQRVALAAHAE